MAVLDIRNLTKRYGGLAAVEALDLSVAHGEMVALLGESGCGKTTTLRMVAGFVRPDQGRVLIDGREMNDVPAYRRNVGVFFQNYALFPHLSVFDNVAFGLKLKRLPRPEIRRRTLDMLDLVRLPGLEKRFPREISGGQQQRVALARALVTGPSVLLLDEPLSNLDAKLRMEMQVELRRIQRELGITAIIVTHDQEEAVSLADRVAVMRRGRILQTGVPREVFNRPADPFVADFMGFSNFIPGVAEGREGGFALIRCGSVLLWVPEASFPYAPGTALTLAIRPDHIALAEPGTAGSHRGRISALTYRGNTTRLEVSELFEKPLYLHVRSYAGPDSGPVSLSFPPEKLLAFPADSGNPH
ncbi:MAG: ABC transporter ATP-binding protein [Treponema sp.]|nr:ABC transporter ATP-binding protein [Treponema sp.]